MNVSAMEINGAAELERKLLGLDRKVARKVVRQALRAGAKIVRAAARSEAPTRSGFLRRSIKVRTAKRNRAGTYAILVSSGSAGNMYSGDAYYGAFVHFGHRIGSRKLGDSRRLVAANPFIRRGYDASESSARQAIMRQLAAGIEAAAREKS